MNKNIQSLKSFKTEATWSLSVTIIFSPFIKAIKLNSG